MKQEPGRLAVRKIGEALVTETQGWARELHLKLLGLPAVLPPPEEEKDVKTAIGAARAKQARKEML